MAKELESGIIRNPLVFEPLSHNTFANASLSLTADQNFILVAERMLVKAYNDTMYDYHDGYELAIAVVEEIKDTALESIATEAGIARLSDIAFKNDVARELVLNIQTRFIISFSEYNDKWKDVLKLATKTLTHMPIGVPIDKEKYLVPDDIVSRIYSEDTLLSILQNNTWLVILLFIKLWVKTKSFDELRLKHKEGLISGTANSRNN